MTPAHRRKRLFTIGEANAALPLVRVITRDIVQISQTIIQTRQRLEIIRHSDDFDPLLPMYHDEVLDVERNLVTNTDRLKELVNEIVELGAEPKGLAHGLIDFPALRYGKVVYLCWQYGEPEVKHWHTLTGGFIGRKSIDDGLLRDTTLNTQILGADS